MKVETVKLCWLGYHHDVKPISEPVYANGVLVVHLSQDPFGSTENQEQVNIKMLSELYKLYSDCRYENDTIVACKIRKIFEGQGM